MTSPPPVFFARIKGGAEYVCPHCARFQAVQQLNWRLPRRQCTNKQCTLTLGFGVLVTVKPLPRVPVAAVYAAVPQNHATHNFMDHIPGAVPAIGQIVGALEWWCPACTAKNKAAPLMNIGYGRCQACAHELFFALALLRPLRGAHAVTPTDWIAPMESHV